MSGAVGADNPAFASEDDCGAKLENGGQQQQQVTSDQDRKPSADGAPIENGHQRSFVSQHYIEPVKSASEPCYKTETRIELPADNNTEKSLPEPKLNGIHGNGNNNDASFLNNSAASAQVNGEFKRTRCDCTTTLALSHERVTCTGTYELEILPRQGRRKSLMIASNCISTRRGFVLARCQRWMVNKILMKAERRLLCKRIALASLPTRGFSSVSRKIRYHFSGRNFRSV